MNRFEGKVAIVTGAAHGIGRATAVRLAAEGASVAVADVDLEAAEQVVNELAVPGIAVECDITSRASVDAAVAATVERFGRLDVLAQVAGHNLANRQAVEPGDAQWAKQYDFTFTGAVRCIEAALPHLVTTEGAVVLVGSISGVVALGTNPYAAAKAALSSLVRNLAADHGPTGVRFNIVAPATVATRAFKDPQVLEELKAIYPLRRVGQPEDVAAAVAFLASTDANWITGITLPVEGGLTTGPGHLIS
ncbi:SDR family NAD(P)-dependent oxidoreductase [Kribbella endophytica]